MLDDLNKKYVENSASGHKKTLEMDRSSNKKSSKVKKQVS